MHLPVKGNLWIMHSFEEINMKRQLCLISGNTAGCNGNPLMECSPIDRLML